MNRNRQFKWNQFFVCAKTVANAHTHTHTLTLLHTHRIQKHTGSKCYEWCSIDINRILWMETLLGNGKFGQSSTINAIGYLVEILFHLSHLAFNVAFQSNINTIYFILFFVIFSLSFIMHTCRFSIRWIKWSNAMN